MAPRHLFEIEQDIKKMHAAVETNALAARSKVIDAGRKAFTEALVEVGKNEEIRKRTIEQAKGAATSAMQTADKKRREAYRLADEQYRIEVKRVDVSLEEQKMLAERAMVAANKPLKAQIDEMQRRTDSEATDAYQEVYDANKDDLAALLAERDAAQKALEEVRVKDAEKNAKIDEERAKKRAQTAPKAEATT